MIKTLKRYKFHICPICKTIYSCGQKSNCCAGQETICPNCDPEPVSRKFLKKITIVQFHFFPFHAMDHTLLQKVKGKWRVYMVNTKKKLTQVLNDLVYDTPSSKNGFKIIKFNEAHRMPAVNHKYRIALTNNYDSYVKKNLKK